MSDRDYTSLTKHNWYIGRAGYAATKLPGNVYIELHNLIFKAPKGFEVDHKNQNKLDNRRCNLRVCTKAQNRQNRGLQRNSTSGFKGVHYHKENKSWVAYIGKTPRKHIGSFKNKRLAALAYNKAAKKYFGKYACINKV